MGLKAAAVLRATGRRAGLALVVAVATLAVSEAVLWVAVRVSPDIRRLLSMRVTMPGENYRDLADVAGAVRELQRIRPQFRRPAQSGIPDRA